MEPVFKMYKRRLEEMRKFLERGFEETNKVGGEMVKAIDGE
jgi:hypothetical protein